MIQNWYIIFVAVLMPMVMAFIWYKPKVLRALCMSAFGMSEEVTNALFEAKGFTSIAVNAGCCIISLTFMRGIVCKWA